MCLALSEPYYYVCLLPRSGWLMGNGSLQPPLFSSLPRGRISSTTVFHETRSEELARLPQSSKDRRAFATAIGASLGLERGMKWDDAKLNFRWKQMSPGQAAPKGKPVSTSLRLPPPHAANNYASLNSSTYYATQYYTCWNRSSWL